MKKEFSSKRLLRSAVLSLVIVALVFATFSTALGATFRTCKASFETSPSANYALESSGQSRSGQIDGENTPLTSITTPIKPAEYQRMLGVGMDVGWMQFKKDMESYTPQVPADFKKVGFSHVRIRINEDPLTPEFLSRLKSVVNDCLKNNLIPIIAFTAENFKQHPTEANMEKVVSWWRTVAQTFKGYPYPLSYDIIVEVGENLKDPTLLNECYERTVSAIRKVDPYRIIFISPIKRSNPYYLNLLKIPQDANGYLMVEWHFYAAGPSKTNPKSLWTSGTPAEKKLIEDKVQAALDYQKKTGLYSWVGAWMPGNYNHGNDYTISEQVFFATFMSCALRRAHIPYAINADTKFYDNTTHSWIKPMLPVLNAVLRPDCGIPAPQSVKAVALANGIFVKWSGVNYQHLAGYALYRESSNGNSGESSSSAPVLLAKLPKGKTLFIDRSAKEGVRYTYFVKAFDDAWPQDYSKPSASVSAAILPGTKTVITLRPNSPLMTINGIQQEIDPGRGTKPVIIPKWGRTVVPIRAIVEALGGTIEWDPVQRMVTINFEGKTINLWIDKPQAQLNGVMKWIDPNNHDVKPIIINDRTMLPLRFVAENLGCTVEWDASTRTITITYTP